MGSLLNFNDGNFISSQFFFLSLPSRERYLTLTRTQLKIRTGGGGTFKTVNKENTNGQNVGFNAAGKNPHNLDQTKIPFRKILKKKKIPSSLYPHVTCLFCLVIFVRPEQFGDNTIYGRFFLSFFPDIR